MSKSQGSEILMWTTLVHQEVRLERFFDEFYTSCDVHISREKGGNDALSTAPFLMQPYVWPHQGV